MRGDNDIVKGLRRALEVMAEVEANVVGALEDQPPDQTDEV